MFELQSGWPNLRLMVWSPGPVVFGVVVLATASILSAHRDASVPVPAEALSTVARIALGSALATLISAELIRRPGKGRVNRVLAAQSLYATTVVLVGAALGAVGTRLRLVHADVSTGFDRAVWVAGAAVILWACFRIAASARRLVLEGESASKTLLASERQEHAVRVRALQLKAEPELMLRAMAAIATCAERAPADADRAVEAVAVYLRTNLRHIPEPTASVDEEERRTREYLDLLAFAGLAFPVTWTVDDDVRAVLIPTGTLRTFVDYAVARCERDSGTPTIKVRAYHHAGRFYLIVSDTAAADPPMLAEPDALWALRERTGAPPKRKVRVETSLMLEVDGTAAGTTQTLSMKLEEAA